MAGTDEEAVAAADDALYVLTAVLLTPAKFPSVLGDDYPEACAALGMAPLADGYGLVLGQDGDGARWTVVIDDVSLVAVAIASWDCGMEYDLSPDERTVVAALPGWPLAVAVAAPNVPPPHDPDPEIADGPPLTPPDTSVWGPAQRRLGADEIALQWATWREQIDDTEFATPGGASGGASGSGESSEPGGSAASGASAASAADGAADAAEAVDEDAGSDSGAGAGADEQGETGEQSESGQAGKQGGHSGILRVLAEARAYVESPPPLGRVRSSFAPGDARTLRADGPGWSLVARTDDIAFVLLDDEPGEVLPVGRGPELPGLLEALDKMAVRPL
ncbi:hypothetical protein [Streptomyces sp. PAN_FS17]|uniref:hypothetical protein n=1 Tax=Streptomyces sp. PAN_FS17 TaxID=1855351 RepID=UPI0004CC0E9E|nr:hypothetical protein [Streptomyces sp. PAN_FS17]SEB93952.1 hypothetical protein SAMN05216482_1512 [Streptomyces sp. PAN_FS17]